MLFGVETGQSTSVAFNHDHLHSHVFDGVVLSCFAARRLALYKIEDILAGKTLIYHTLQTFNGVSSELTRVVLSRLPQKIYTGCVAGRVMQVAIDSIGVGVEFKIQSSVLIGKR